VVDGKADDPDCGWNAKRRTLAWFRVQLTEEQQRIVHEERASHPHPRVREKMLVLWLLPCGLTRHQAAAVAGVGRATVQWYLAAFRDGDWDGLRRWDVKGPVSELAASRDRIRESFQESPVGTRADACERLHQLSGLRRGPPPVRKFLRDLGREWRRARPIPVPPQTTWPSPSPSRLLFSTPS
jgi:transposase